MVLNMSVHEFIVKDAENNDVLLNDYKGKVLLIVNTATACGLTPQYDGLQSLYEKYADQGFEILDFPSNQFLNQAPGTNEEIVSFCQLNFGTTFKTFGKIDVNGENADPLYKYLKAQKPSDAENKESEGFLGKLKSINQAVLGSSIKWNFTKFLVNQDGHVVKRYSPTVKPEEIEGDIEALLQYSEEKAV